MNEKSEPNTEAVETAPYYSMSDMDQETIDLLVDDKIATGG